MHCGHTHVRGSQALTHAHAQSDDDYLRMEATAGVDESGMGGFLDEEEEEEVEEDSEDEEEEEEGGGGGGGGGGGMDEDYDFSRDY